MKIQFQSGQGVFFPGSVNYLLSEDGTLYAETQLPEDVENEYGERVSPVSEDYGYLALKRAIIALAEGHSVDPETLSFQYDGQEQYLAADADVQCDVRSEWRGE